MTHMPAYIATLTRICKLARVADPVNNAADGERATAIREILKVASAAVAGGSSGESDPGEGTVWLGASVRAVWHDTLRRSLTRSEWQSIHDYVLALGVSSVESITRYAIQHGVDERDRWRYFCNICHKRVRENR